MITKVILKFEDLEQEQQDKVLNWLLNCEEKKETQFKLFLHKGGVNNKMIEIASQASDPGKGMDTKQFGARTKWRELSIKQQAPSSKRLTMVQGYSRMSL